MTISRQIYVLRGLLSYRLQTQFAHIGASWVSTISTSVFCAVYLATFGLIAQRVGNVGGFTRDQIYLSLLVGELTFLFSVGQVYEPANGLNRLVNDGGLDFLLIRPFSARAMISVQYSNLVGALQNALFTGIGISLLINWHSMRSG
jgi:ABC-type uncharacterized transport system permease subunit